MQIKEVTAEKIIAFLTKILFNRYVREIPNKILIKENLIKGAHNTVVFFFLISFVSLLLLTTNIQTNELFLSDRIFYLQKNMISENSFMMLPLF